MKAKVLKRIVSLALTVTLLWSVMAALNITSYAATWESESNNSFSTADSMSVNSEYRGNVNFNNDYDDYYKFTLSSNGIVSFSFSHQMLDTSMCYWELYLYDSNQNELREFDFHGNYTSETSYNLGLPKGTYYLRVRIYNSEANYIDYTLKANFTSSNYWETEKNDSYTTADNISVNTNYYGNVNYNGDYDDYYKFTLNTAGCFSVTLSHEKLDTSMCYWEVYLYDGNQNEIREFDFHGNYTSETSYNLGLPKGTYYLRVRIYNSEANYIDYTLKANFTSSNYWETEKNDSYTTADNISVNTNYYGNVNYNGDYDDYYKFTLNTEGFFSVTFSHEKLDISMCYWEVYLYDGNQNEIREFDFHGNYSSEKSENLRLPKGTYYLKVKIYNSEANYIDYTLKVNSCRYPDVPADAWYFDSVEYVSNKGYITGYSNGYFGPTDSLKRQDFVCILARIAKADLSGYQNSTSKFKDVKKGTYYAAAVNWAVDNGIINGYNNGKFGVNDNITREQIATILYNYEKSPSVSNPDNILRNYSDKDRISSYAKTPVAWAVQKKIISGMSDGRLAPTKSASRAEIAAIVMNMDKQGMFK